MSNTICLDCGNNDVPNGTLCKCHNPIKLLSKEGQKAVKEELKKDEFRPYHKGRGWE